MTEGEAKGVKYNILYFLSNINLLLGKQGLNTHISFSGRPVLP